MSVTTAPELASVPRAAMRASICFHCGQPVPADADFSVAWDGAARTLCCRGCQAVARTIVGSGLGDYYRRRDASAPTATELVPEILHELSLFDHPAVQQSFVHRNGDQRDAALILEGIVCASCVWLNEQHLKRLPGVLDVGVNYSTGRVRLTWDETRIHLSGILAAIRAIGYRAHPYDPGRSQQLFARERATLLRRLGIAGVFGAQVMTLGVALYVGDWGGSDPALRTFFFWASLLLTLPVLLYSSQPFFHAAWNDLRRRRAGMDVPIALGLGGAFIASAWTTVTGHGTVYYDSVAMFALFLLGGRYLELNARSRAAAAAESLVQATPALAVRLDARGNAEHVAVAELVRADRVRILPGESVPADGVVVSGCSSVDESLLTGESLPLPKRPGDTLIGGSINIESPLTLRVDKTGPDTVLAAMLRLLDRAQMQKPRLTQFADRLAAHFVVAVLLLAAAAGLYWWHIDAARALPIAIAVLVVTCPCALGLAAPTTLAAATGALTRRGLLTTRGHALETLARATHFVFDKTGTLTRGRPQVSRVHGFDAISPAYALTLAAALESHSEHPIGQAIVTAAGATSAAACNVRNFPGEGLSGEVGGEHLYLGTASFIERCAGCVADADVLADMRAGGGSVILLATRTRLLAAYALDDTLRPGAVELIAELKRLGKHVILLTGDHALAARHVARTLDIDDVHADLKPRDKLARLQALQARGAIVAMIGDGVNDAPVLAAAQVSIAVAGAAHVSAASADMLLLSPDLRRLIAGVRTARRALRIVRQNLGWALAYNLLAVPAAVAGLVTPWMAALGMSWSSLLVMANALRLLRDHATSNQE